MHIIAYTHAHTQKYIYIYIYTYICILPYVLGAEPSGPWTPQPAALAALVALAALAALAGTAEAAPRNRSLRRSRWQCPVHGNHSQMLHGAGIFTYISLMNHPFL